MNTTSKIKTISLIGGTGALGTGLARRWAKAGYAIVIGSRTADKAVASAAALQEELPEATISGMENLEAAQAGDLVVITVPFAHHPAILERIKPGVAGKILIDTTVPLVPPKVARVQLPAEGCAAAITQRTLGDDVAVVSAFQNVAADLLASDENGDCDVLVTGDRVDARETVIELARQAGFRAWHAGPLDNAAAAEAMTSILIHMNRRYGAPHAGIRITGVPE